MEKIMNRKNLIITVLSVFVGVIFAFNMFFIVDNEEQAVLFQFNQPSKIIEKNGLNVKIPFIQNVVKVDKRLQEILLTNKKFITADGKEIFVDFVVIYKIVNPTLFIEKNQNEAYFENNLYKILLSDVEIEDQNLADLKYSYKINKMDLGVDIVEAKITKIHISEKESEKIRKNMVSDFEKSLKIGKVKTDVEIEKINSLTEKEKSLLIYEAKRRSEELKGEGDNLANKVYLKAYSKDPDFFEFYKKMQIYKSSLKPENTKLILTKVKY